MKLLIVHNEALYFAGAERMLGYFLSAAGETGLEISVAAVPSSRVMEIIPKGIPVVPLTDNQKFSPWNLARQVREIIHARPKFGWQLLHGWAARDWELTSLASAALRLPAAGTLHDHPRAHFIGRSRKWLMRVCARRGLDRIICVSHAVERECGLAGYPVRKLETIHNGLPGGGPARERPSPGAPFRLGYIGVFSERKGLRGFFATADELSGLIKGDWELKVAGEAQDEASRQLVAAIKADYGNKPWWGRVHWAGWQRNPAEFVRGLDLLACPSTEFDPFPTVLLEAAQNGVPVLASRVGGVPEIVADGQTGWIFAPGAWREAAVLAAGAASDRPRLWEAGVRARERFDSLFLVRNMVAKHQKLYSNLVLNV